MQTIDCYFLRCTYRSPLRLFDCEVTCFLGIYPNYSICESEFFRQHYSQIQKGIGAHKSPEAYGSFPFDPYSHTLRMAGITTEKCFAQKTVEFVQSLVFLSKFDR